LRRKRPVSALAFDEIQAAFHSGNRHDIERRELELVIREDERDGAPPRARVDPDRKKAVIIR
jgi:uncharacterized protein DUF6191